MLIAKALKRPMALSLLVVSALLNVEAQDVSLKHNLLYDATLTPNLGLEVTVGQRSSFQLFYGLNPWNGYHGRKKLQHWSLMPEYRYWLHSKHQHPSPNTHHPTPNILTGWFTGLHAVGGEYNVAGVKLPFGLFKPLRTNHYEGSYWGGGVTLGHAWRLSDQWRLEAAVGVGLIWTKYKQYENVECGDLLADDTYLYIGPTKLALNIAYVFGKKKETPSCPPIEGRITPEAICPSPAGEVERGPSPVKTVTTRRERHVYHLNGRAWLDFRVNQTDIDPLFRRNGAELDSVMKTVYVVTNDTNLTVTHITIHGFASPEGKQANNQRLAQGRAEALKQYIVQRTQLSDLIFSIETTAEDWNGLQQALAQRSDIPQCDQILTLIRQEIEAGTDLDRLEQLIRSRYPKSYQLMLRDIYPTLRHSDYTISYTQQEYSTEQIVEEK